MSQDWQPITAYVADMSYFSGKMEGYLRYKEIPYARTVVDAGIMHKVVLPATGLMKVPVIQLADGAWLKDTTPMIDWFEARRPDPPVVPRDPVRRFLSKLIEDYADEWCWRAALYWRWHFPESRQLLTRRIGQEVLGNWPVPNALSGWYYAHRQITTFLHGDGLTRATEPHIKKHYLDLLDSMSQLLADAPYLLGSHPTLVDIGLFGPMFRHYALDPTPAKVMLERAPAVFEWVARLWNARASQFPKEIAWTSFEHPGWQFFWRDIVTSYWPFLVRNARAWRAGRDRFDHRTDAVTFANLKVVHYRVWCLEVLQNQYRALTAEQRDAVDAALAPYGQLQLVDVDSGLASEYQLPLSSARSRPSRWQRMKLFITGTPWDMPRNE